MSAAEERQLDAGPDLSACEQEPIHIPCSIEPNGVLLVVREPELTIVQVSSNAGFLLGTVAEQLLGMSLVQILSAESLEIVRQRIFPGNLHGRRRYVSGVHARGSEQMLDASVHRHEDLLIIELEPSVAETAETSLLDSYAPLTDAVADLEGRFSLGELCRRVATQVRRLTGFDRVMVYRFLEDDTGSVIAEDLRADLQPYLGLRYPASDIPAQARRLYLLNTLRLKADVSASPVPLVPAVNPVTGRPLDMTYCILRSMSPVHVEYLRNMGASASMSVSIVKDERLWGLIACHHTSAKTIPYPLRTSCEVLAKIFSSRIAAAEVEDRKREAMNTLEFREELEDRLRASSDIRGTLIEEGDRLASVIGCEGAAICLGGQITLVGVTPRQEIVEDVLEWVTHNQQRYLFWTEKFSEQWPGAEGHQDTAGLLSARIAVGSTDFILWFRPPAVKIINWAGNPAKPVEETEAGKRVSPRLSFERWKQTVGDRSEPWREHERDFALLLRQTVAEVLLTQKNLEVVRLNMELERSNIELDAFAYTASHDLQEPVRTIRAYAQLLTRRTGPKLDDESRELLKFIENGATRMGNLVSALLAYGQVGGSLNRERKSVNLDDVMRWVLMNLNESIQVSGGTVTYEGLPTVAGDPELLTQLMQNLIGNAIKYRRADEAPRVTVTAARQGTTWQIGVYDNGEGFEAKDAELIFGAFKRLHGRDIPGTGIGLALCRRIVEHHGGRIWAESEGKGHGATFWFTLPQ